MWSKYWSQELCLILCYHLPRLLTTFISSICPSITHTTPLKLSTNIYTHIHTERVVGVWYFYRTPLTYLFIFILSFPPVTLCLNTNSVSPLSLPCYVLLSLDSYCWLIFQSTCLIFSQPHLLIRLNLGPCAFTISQILLVFIFWELSVHLSFPSLVSAYIYIHMHTLEIEIVYFPL